MAKRNDHGYGPIVTITIWSFPHSGLVTRVRQSATYGAETA